MLEISDRMLHPATIVVEFARLVGRLAVAIVALLVVRLTGGGSGDLLEIFATAAGVFGVIGAALRYATVRFSVHQGNLTIRSGILFKQIRTVPLDRIQNINLRRSLLHRLLQVVDLKIETAAGTGAEVELSVLGERDAEALRLSLLGNQPEDTAPDTSKPATLYRATTRELIVAGATENRFLIIVGGFFSLYFFFRPQDESLVQRLIDSTGRFYALGEPYGMLILGFLILFLAGWILSMARSFIQYHGFELVPDGDRLVRRYGLIQHVETVIPLNRVQMVRLESNGLQRLFGYGKLYAETAGSLVESEQGGSTVLTPMTPLNEVSTLMGAVRYPIDFRTAAWQPLGKLALYKAAIGWTVLILGLAIFAGRQPWSLVAVGLLIPFAAWYAPAAYRAAGYATTDHLVLYRVGLWKQTVFAVPRTKLQSAVISQGPWQQKLSLADLELMTAASGGRGTVRLGEIPLESAELVAAELANPVLLPGHETLDAV